MEFVMGGNLSGFDASTVNPTDSACLPIGEYRVVAVESSVEDKPSGAQMLSVTLQVLGGNYQNRKIWVSECLKQKDGNKNQQGLGKLSALCRAVGVLTPKDTTELHNIPFVATVGIKKQEDGYSPKNIVQKYTRIATDAPAVSQAPQAQTATAGGPW
jgi:hypothetical protein